MAPRRALAALQLVAPMTPSVRLSLANAGFFSCCGFCGERLPALPSSSISKVVPLLILGISWNYWHDIPFMSQ